MVIECARSRGIAWVAMFVVVLIVGLILLVTGGLTYDQMRLNRRRMVDRGFDVVARQVGTRLRFRQPVRADLAFFLEMAADPQAAEANGWTGQEGAAIHKRFADRSNFEQHRQSELVAIERSTNALVGTATFSPSPIDPERARSIGVHVHPRHRGNGYGRELTAAAIVLMQGTPGRVHLGTRTSNLGMQHIMKDLGFCPQPETFAYRAPDGKDYESFWYQCGADTHAPAGLRSA